MNKFEILTIVMAIVVVISSVALVGVISTQDKAIEPSVSELKNEVVKLRSDIDAEKQSKQAVQEKLDSAKRDIELMKKEVAVPQPVVVKTAEPVDYDTALKDLTKLTLKNCNEVIDFAYEQEQDIDDRIDDLEETEDKYKVKLNERRDGLKTAIESGDDDEIRTWEKRVDYVEEKLDDVQDEISILERDYNSAKRLRIRAESHCTRLERAF